MHKLWRGAGIGFIVLAVVILGLGLWEGFIGAGANLHRLELPGFHELELKEPGLYAGIYQHQGPGPIPAAALAKLSVKVFTKDGFREIPVALNTAGETFARMGQQGMLLFNFAISEPGLYTISGLYLEAVGPTVPVLLISQGVRNTKPTLIVSGFFFLFFMILGIWMVRKKEI
jgi:hypothetical protein